MRIIQIAASNDTLYALADDGSVWIMLEPRTDIARWKKMIEIGGVNAVDTRPKKRDL
jgi:hypothetical protein